MPKLGMEAIRRRQVIDAVINILATHGWRELTIREVSEVAGISAGVVTHYFNNKRTLTLDAISDACRQCTEAFTDIQRRRGGVRMRLLALVDLIARPDPPGLPDWRFWLAVVGRMPFDRVIQGELQKVRRLYAEFLESLVRQGIAEGEITKSVDVDDSVAKFAAISMGMGSAMVTDPIDMPPARCRRLLIGFLEEALGMELANSHPSIVVEKAARER